MSIEFSDLVRIAGITVLVTALWGASVAGTYWDTHRRGLKGSQAFPWLALVTLAPIAGFIVYLMIRTAAVLFRPKRAETAEEIRRETALKEPQSRRSMPTLLGSNLVMETVASPIELKRNGPKYLFTVTSGPDKNKEFIVTGFPAKIGRGVEVAVRLDEDLGVSRQQAEIYQEAGSLRIRDLNSAHGTQVNGSRIDDARLEPGDRIQVGQSILIPSEIED